MGIVGAVIQDGLRIVGDDVLKSFSSILWRGTGALEAHGGDWPHACYSVQGVYRESYPKRPSDCICASLLERPTFLRSAAFSRLIAFSKAARSPQIITSTWDLVIAV